MPGDNVEMICDLVHEAAAEVGTRFTLREGGKTSKHLCPVFPARDSHERSQLEPVLSQSSLKQLKPFAFWPPRLIPPVIRVRVRYKSCCLPLLILPSLVLRHSPHSQKVETSLLVHRCIHILQPATITYAFLAMRTSVALCSLCVCEFSATRFTAWTQPVWYHIRGLSGPHPYIMAVNIMGVVSGVQCVWLWCIWPPTRSKLILTHPHRVHISSGPRGEFTQKWYPAGGNIP